jgi:broad specificity phosphatase PhoE
MAQLILVRHGQASFGQANYDKLSDLGHDQAVALGQTLLARGISPDVWACGTMVRQAETLRGIQRGLGFAAQDPIVHAGLNEYDFTGLLNARFANEAPPEGIHTDRKVHFQNLRSTVAAWQDDDITDPPETWATFAQRTAQACRDLMAVKDAKTILAVSSGGAISQIVSTILETSKRQQIELQLQIKNASMTTVVFSATKGARFVSTFNETPFVTHKTEHLLSYS